MNRGLPVLDLARGQGQRSRSPSLTKRIADSGNEIGTVQVVFIVYEPIVSYLILHLNGRKNINRRINRTDQH